MNDEQTNCSRCGARILLITAHERGGLCVPCARGEREKIEEGKEYYRAMQAYYESPPYLFWVSLTRKERSAMSEAEQIFYALNCLKGEVSNGGFHQYFSNSSGDDYEIAERSLRHLGPPEALNILEEAKALVFGEGKVPDWTGRNAALDRLGWESPEMAELSRLDERFWKLLDEIDLRLDTFAIEQGFYPAGGQCDA